MPSVWIEVRNGKRGRSFVIRWRERIKGVWRCFARASREKPLALEFAKKKRHELTRLKLGISNPLDKAIATFESIGLDELKLLDQRAQALAPEIEKKILKRYSDTRHGAKSRAILFNLPLEKFRVLWRQPCFYCRGPIDGIGLDRLDSNQGYTPENVVPCCKFCNRMKQDLSLKEFILRCATILENCKNHVRQGTPAKRPQDGEERSSPPRLSVSGSENRK